MQTEEWKQIKKYPDYFVSNTGKILSTYRLVLRKNGCKYLVKEKLLKQSKGKNGYLVVNLKLGKKSYTNYVHALVSDAFIGERRPGEQVNHIDFNKENNHAENLEVISQRENLKHTRINNRHCFGERIPNSVLKDSDVLKIKKLLKNYNQTDIAKMFGVCSQTIWCIANKKTWKHLEDN